MSEAETRLALYQHLNTFTSRMLMALKRLQTWLDDPDQALKVDSEFYEKVQRELVISSALSYRQHLVAGTSRGVSLHPGDEESSFLVPIYQRALDHVARFSSARFNLARAFFAGTAVAVIHGTWARLLMPGDWTVRRWWVPTHLEDVDKGRLRVEFGDDRTQRWTLFDVYREAWVVLDETNQHMVIWHQYDTADRHLGFGGGLAAQLVYYWTVKTLLLEALSSGASRIGFGWIHARIKNLLGAASATDLTTYSTLVDQVIAQVEKQRSHNVFVSDMDAVELDAFAPPGANNARSNIVMESLNYVDRVLTTRILGSVLPTGGGDQAQGSMARAQVEKQSEGSLIAYDRETLAESLGALCRCFRVCNERNLRAMGVWDMTDPEFHLGIEKPDPQVAGASLDRVAKYQIPVRKTDVYEALEGFSQPDANDDVMTLQMAQGADAGAPGAGSGLGVAGGLAHG